MMTPRIKKHLKWLFVMVLAFGVMACTDEPESSYDEPSYDKPASNITKPSFGHDLSWTGYDDVTFNIMVKTGGDNTSNVECYVHWKNYGTAKPATKPSKNELTKVESMRHYKDTKTTVDFQRAHAGFVGGSYIYYYFEATNSKGTVETDVRYHIIKR